MTPTQVDALVEARSAEIATSIVAESARWGGGQFTRDVHWQNTIDDLHENFFPLRTDALLQQYRSRGLYPQLEAPAFNQHGGQVGGDFRLTITAPVGTIYYTPDGSDPRQPGGAIAPGALVYGAAIPLDDSTLVKARARSGGEWSALNDATFLVNLPAIAISEIHYDPVAAAGGSFESDDFEFIEIYNYGSVAVELEGVRLVNGVDFDFTGGDVALLNPDEFVLVVRDRAAFESRYELGLPVAGVYEGKLKNEGEKIELVDAFDQTIADFSYNNGWYDLTDGVGFSLNLRDLSDADADLGESVAWRPSSALHGTPGTSDSFTLDAYMVPAPGAVVINEVLAHSDELLGDWIELHNTTDAPIEIGGWFLSDDRDDPLKYEIPSGTIIAAGGFATFTELQHFGALFALSELGDDVVCKRSGAQC